MMVNCSPGWKELLHIYKDSESTPNGLYKTRSFEDNKYGIKRNKVISCNHTLPLKSETINNVTYYNTSVSSYM